MGRDPEDYLAGGDDDNTSDMTADASLLGYLQLSDDSNTSSGYLMHLKSPWSHSDDEA